MKAKDPTITQDYARSILDYNPDSGIFTYLPRTPEHFEATETRSAQHRCRYFNKRYAGKDAGAFNGSGYKQIYINGRLTPAHRLAWFYVHGVWPPYDVDHINHDRSDNRLSNLRLATRSQNQLNVPVQKNNKLGVKGVHRHGRKFTAYVHQDGRQVYLGLFPTLEAAKSAYDAKVAELYGEFAPIKSALTRDNVSKIS